MKLHRSMQMSLLLFAALSALPAHAAQDTWIPELGEPSSQTLSAGQEREIGGQFYRQARSQAAFITDSQVNHYIQSLGDRLVNRNTLGNQSFTFFVFDNSAVNAFAVPGGYIGVYSGLIEAAQNESQFVSVIAHEIAHVTRHHIARIYAKQEGVSLATTAAIIAGILAGGQVGNASIYAGMAVNQQSQINFTRSHELEADRFGIKLMENAQYDTQSMPLMFELLQKDSLQGDSERYAFLRTHPVSSQRIAEARSRADKYINPGAVIDSLAFRLIKSRLEVLTTNNLQQLRRKFEWRIADNNIPQNAYALAFIHLRLGAPEQAAKYIEQLIDTAPQSIYVQLLQAQILAELGQLDRALAVFAELHDNYPFHYPILEAYTEALSRKDRHGQAKSLLRDYLFNAPVPQPKAHKLLAFHLNQLGEMASSRIKMADYFVKTNEPEAAFSQLRLALKAHRLSEEDARRLNAKLQEVKQFRLQ